LHLIPALSYAVVKNIQPCQGCPKILIIPWVSPTAIHRKAFQAYLMTHFRTFVLVYPVRVSAVETLGYVFLMFHMLYGHICG
jgi:hypothetical protein